MNTPDEAQVFEVDLRVTTADVSSEESTLLTEDPAVLKDMTPPSSPISNALALMSGTQSALVTRRSTSKTCASSGVFTSSRDHSMPAKLPVNAASTTTQSAPPKESPTITNARLTAPSKPRLSTVNVSLSSSIVILDALDHSLQSAPRPLKVRRP